MTLLRMLAGEMKLFGSLERDIELRPKPI